MSLPLSVQMCDPYHPEEAAAVEGFFTLRQKVFTGPKGLRKDFDLSPRADKSSIFAVAQVGNHVVGGVRLTRCKNIEDLPQLQNALRHLPPEMLSHLKPLRNRNIIYVDHAVVDSVRLPGEEIGGMEILGNVLRQLLEMAKQKDTDVIVFAPHPRLALALRHAQRSYHFPMAEWGSVSIPNMEGAKMTKELVAIVLNEDLQQALRADGVAVRR